MSEPRWWAGSSGRVEDDALYDCNFATRDEAVAWAEMEFKGDDYFYLILAEADDDAADDPGFDPDYGIPFIAAGEREKVLLPPLQDTHP